MKDNLPNENPGILFLFFSGYTFFCFLIYFKIIVEIKDKSEREIYEEYEKLKICWKRKSENTLNERNSQKQSVKQGN